MNDIPSTVPGVDRRASTGKRTWGLRFSLWTAFLLVTIAVLAVSNWQAAARLIERDEQLTAAQKEIQQLRNEVGYLELGDKTKVHVVAAPTHLDLVWRWKVYVPDGANLKAYGTFKQPTGGSATSVKTLESGENHIELAIYQGPDRTWKRKLTVTRGGSTSSSSSGIPDELVTWTGSFSTSTSGLLRKEGTKVYDVDTEVTLLKMTVEKNKPHNPPDEEAEAEQDQSPAPTTEIAVWIGPEKAL